MTEFLPFSRPTLGAAEEQAVLDVLRSGWITTGRQCQELEASFNAAVGSPYSVALTSATAGMHLCLLAMGIGPGDEVITPSMTWVSTINMIVLLGATPVFADVDRETLMVTRATVEPLITDRTRAIIPVHFAGAALDLEPLRALAQERGLILLEDAAHAIGTHYDGQPVGSSGTAIFSLHPIKNVTSGEGGVVSTQDAALAERVRRLRFHGLAVDAFDRKEQGRAPTAEVQEPGFKYNLPDLNAAIGVVQMGQLESFIARRTHLANLYLEEFRNFEEVQPLGLPTWSQRHAWHLFIVRLDLERTSLSRDEFMAALKELGIGTGLHFRASHLHRFYRERPEFVRQPLAATEWNSERMLSIPLFPGMADEDVARVIAAMKEVLS
ncbi:MAG: UDP-4-amino-4-deoxy-L-arabinose aminotransferase [Planctomycetes bacterium]|nr:UDP-4-amino-4-deoxy-L-arabinose aminotransferase [Planctomycetota bacterium]MCB9913425.1 UDP-4-amino-4-deoxy-L-arabinose aminotransferase [Planctomycetota bacterium]HPF12950.1 aminotransferase class I/II-fold pyridoxal phosphate-dependent enzyme [Planctomycetota bacterium]HRV81044.1 aminotransferase class I/II-fold pyridoxal phosphate-dependent enzyme [Planctomycetota bacterium]